MMPGVPKDTARLDAYEQLDLVEALERTHRTDAHCVNYLVDGFGPRQPRLTKQVVAEGLYSARVTVFMCDVDNPGHALWTDDTKAAAVEFDAANITTEGVYHTSKGRRLVQPLSESLEARASEPYLRRWLLD